MSSTSTDKEKIKRLIVATFKGVSLKDGIGLWQAQAIDDYEVKETQQQARARDELEEWAKIPGEDLVYCYSSLSFFDAKGMRFHLPAYMLRELEQGDCESVVFHLSQFADDPKFSLLNSQQKYAVRVFLEWCLTQDDYHYERPHIERALEKVWRL